jgi:PKD repeat protein
VPASAATRNDVEAPVASIPLPPPTASFEMDPASGDAPLEVQFVDRSTGVPLRWEWDFGEGMPLYEQSPTHTYASAGTYQVTLRVENDEGFGEATRSVTVESPPMAFLIPTRVILGVIQFPTPTPSFRSGSILFANFPGLGDNVHFNTGLSTATYECGIVGMAAMDGDIQEGRTANIVYAYMAEEGGSWWINADFLTHENHEDWDFGVMCISRAMSDSYEFHRRIRVDPEIEDTVDLEYLGIPEDRTCGVVGIAAWNGDIDEGGSGDHLLTAHAQRNAGTGNWELRANFYSEPTSEEYWDVDLLCVYDNPNVFLRHEVYNQLGGRAYDTGISSVDYACGVFGMASANGDINEGGTGSILRAYTYIGAGEDWYVMADFRSHVVEERWNLSLLCVRQTSVDFYGSWVEGWVH